VVSNKFGNSFSLSSGYSDFENKVSIDTNSIIQIASLTKHLTAFAILQLVAQKKISLNDDMNKHLKIKLPFRGVTINNLLSHTSGIPEFLELVKKKWKKSNGPTNDEIFSLYVNSPPKPKFSPGSKFEYNNINYIILSTIVENKTKLKFEDFLRDSVLNKSGVIKLYQTTELLPKKIIFAKGYSHTGENYKVVGASVARVFENRKGSGGIWTSSSDLSKWLNWLFFQNRYYEEVLLKQKISKKVIQHNYLYGWYFKERNKFSYVYSYGKFPGYNSYCAFIPKLDLIVVILGNYEFNSESLGEKYVSKILSKNSN
jgi:CubicO group peptidase (beta-lactamase class C family)